MPSPTATWPPTEGQPFAGEVVVKGQRFANEENGFAVLDGEWDGERIVLVGPLVHLEPGEQATVAGQWVVDPRYGPQVRVREAHPLVPTDDDAVLAYLRRVRHVGPRRAATLMQLLGPEILTEIDRNPHDAFVRAGLATKKAREAASSWDALRATRGLHLLLAPHGLAHLAGRIHQHYGASSYRVVREKPYDLTSVFGVGFTTADAIARGLGAPLESKGRSRAAILHALTEAERDGSTCQPAAALLLRTRELLSGSQPPPATFLAELESDGDVELAQDDEAVWVYRAETARLERELAERVAALLDGAPSDKLSAPEEPPDAGAAGVELTDEQWAGVRGAFLQRLSVVTGGPGTGKTASIRMIGQIARDQRAHVMLVAPTGRAALRMTEATGLDASTVHSALAWIPGEGPVHDEEMPLRTDLVIVDETSMANLELLVTLLRAIGPGTHVVLVGDADQLAPVGAGKPFAELVASGRVPTARLQHIFRQAAGSMIVQGAHAIRVGNAPSFVRAEGMRHDLFFIARPDPVAAREEIVSLVAERLPKHYGVDPNGDIQVFAPVYRGELGIDALNRSLREALNADGPEVGNGRLRLGDKLMLVGRNLHDLGVMNGSLLRLLQEVKGSSDNEDEDEPSAEEEGGAGGARGRRRGGSDAGGVLVGVDGGGVVQIPAAEVGQLQLAYACSVHRGQGIELPIAIVVAHPAAGGRFLRREMLYTAITRSTLATIVVGTPEMVARAARTTDAGRRHSRLAQRLDELHA
ncbi:AAA family ATPase [Conexibacter stalactiti]|uniref:AAA family ATPase n=1 Tax=Conexibacter stalactiti TaxID=1940611 RepID=A0ABU4HJS5_9ACTN|nr:AAA family ATPase [Conexibacter stalactiti]MDW5593566.1 AAA family ATPase [Conexibacter stalactiti]MEC5034207.1 AAA family ATPase [Conexibacter stalactiti]